MLRQWCHLVPSYLIDCFNSFLHRTCCDKPISEFTSSALKCFLYCTFYFSFSLQEKNWSLLIKSFKYVANMEKNVRLFKLTFLNPCFIKNNMSTLLWYFTFLYSFHKISRSSACCINSGNSFPYLVDFLSFLFGTK